MNMNCFCVGAIVFAATLLASTANADIVVGLDFTENSATNTDVGTATSATFSTAAASGIDVYIQHVVGGATQTSGDITLSEGGFTGVYSIAVDALSSNGLLRRNGSGTLGSNGGQVTPGDSITFSNLQLNYISGDDVFEFVGFSGVRVANLGAGESFTVNATTIADGAPLGEGNGQTVSPTAPITLANTINFTSNGGAANDGGSINVLDAQFRVAAVPEPSSLAVLGLVSLAFLGRRRK